MTPNGNEYMGPLTDEFRNKMLEKMPVVDFCTGVISDKTCDNYVDWQGKGVKYKWSGIANIYSRYKAFGSSEKCSGRSEFCINAYNFNTYAYLLNDGAVVYLGASHGGPWIVVDVNNFNKGPNEFGRDVFVMKITSNILSNIHVIRPLGAEGTFNKEKNGEVCECSKDKGTKTANYIAGNNGEGDIISGGCCSAYYLITN